MKRLKPGVEQGVHLACAAALWTAVGIFLLYRGIVYLNFAELLWLVIPAVILGSLKSRFVLDRSALAGIERIKNFADNTCIGAIYSWKTWLVVLAMMVFGIWLRHSDVAPALIGFVCVGVGWALVLSSRHAWLAWNAWQKE